jgi:hypothetical protein
MRGTRIWTLGLVLALMIAPAAFAAAATQPSLTGTITAIHPDTHELRVDTANGHETLYLSNITKFMDGSKELKESDLKVGDQVKVDYLLEGYAKTVTKVEVMSQGAMNKSSK